MLRFYSGKWHLDATELYIVEEAKLLHSEERFPGRRNRTWVACLSEGWVGGYARKGDNLNYKSIISVKSAPPFRYLRSTKLCGSVHPRKQPGNNSPTSFWLFDATER